MISLVEKFENIPLGWKPQDGELFNVFFMNKKIGSCSVAFVYDQKSPRKKQQFFPESWFADKKTEQMRPILEVTGLETFQDRNSGNGRLCLQALYGLSKRRACGGRIQVFSDFGSAGFYEHCGFKGGKEGIDGLKYFDPTPQNLSLLFSSGEQKCDCQFIPVDVPKITQKKLSYVDKNLFERMLQKGQRS